jgi:endonuclease-8
LIWFSDGRALHSHMRLHGSWHIYRPHERWQAPAWQMRFMIRTDAFVAVCFRAPVLELLTKRAVERHPDLSSLGPDLLGNSEALPDAAAAAVLPLRTSPELTIGEALLNQRNVAGIGNVFKSEVLYLCGVHPWTKVEHLDDESLLRILQTAQHQLAANVGTGPRRTRRELGVSERFWVYGRSGKPCARCGTPIRMERQGASRRSTYYCPKCQAAI